MNDDKARIEHMVEHIKRIQTQLQNVTEEQFYNSLVLVDAVSFNFAILGEAANMVSDELHGRYSTIPWRNIIGMRNFLIHGYMKLQPRYLWETAQNDLLPLLRQLEEILKSFETDIEDKNATT
ncbi:MAG: DUF86 domain-containing protein [Victivallales bacterium]|nr:DUF86 domain-containing protein [Victivallales bacterium]MBO7621879.1 DUF86 domain-containing protein [Victivallales bacterium]